MEGPGEPAAQDLHFAYGGIIEGVSRHIWCLSELYLAPILGHNPACNTLTREDLPGGLIQGYRQRLAREPSGHKREFEEGTGFKEAGFES